MHYGIGEHYNLHHDWFQPDNPGYAERVKDRGQRLVSIFVYLSDCEVCWMRMLFVMFCVPCRERVVMELHVQ